MYDAQHRADDTYPFVLRRGPLGVLMFVALALVVLVFLAGCNIVPGASAASQPKATPPAVRSVTVGAQSLLVYALFSTDKTRQQGLQKTVLPAHYAAVFTWDGATTQSSFWMIHTPQPLSLLWVLAGRVVGHVEMAKCSLSCPTYKAPTTYDTAIEAPAGTFARTSGGESVVFS